MRDRGGKDGGRGEKELKERGERAKGMGKGEITGIRVGEYFVTKGH